jgi:hypothetical protein
MGKLMTVYKFLPDSSLSHEPVSKIVLLMSKMVKDIRRQAPELEEYSLYDVGLKPVHQRIDIRFYFTYEK